MDDRLRPRARIWGIAILAAALVSALAIAGISIADRRPASKKPVSGSPTTGAPPGTTVVRVASQPLVPPTTLIATLRSPTPKFAAPGGPPTGTIPPTWHSAASSLPVIATKGQWLEVRLAPRPNGSTAWIRRSTTVSLSETPYRIVINLGTKHLELYRAGQQTLDAPAGIGTDAYPTPTGQYFLAFFAAAPSPGYGPFVMVTSAHSDRITDWESSGDALVAIHGPLGSDALIGTNGAAVSHGCVRLHNADLEQLRDVPAGTPIEIIAG